MCLYSGDKTGIVVMEDTLQNSIATNTLYKEYNWYQNTVPVLVQESCNGFFEEKFKVMLIGVSQNINCLIDNESCFVTKIRINKDYDMFFRMTETALDIILNIALGQSKNKFNINKMSDLEAKVITSFNDFMFENLKKLLSEPNSVQFKRANFDVIHLTFLLKETDIYNYKTGKIIITLPKCLLKPQAVQSASAKFSEINFPGSETYAKALIGKTKFSLYDIKNLEQDDVVVFEDSNINNITITVNGQDLSVKLNPNMDLLISDYNDGGNNMPDTNQNIWDSIEVEMSAEFDTVKITLGELKNIEEGLVVDITSLYDNNVTLKVENKPIASGALVIVNDRYGVKINNIIADGVQGGTAKKSTQGNTQETINEPSEETQTQQAPPEAEQAEKNDEDEFDYSDFELEDDNI